MRKALVALLALAAAVYVASWFWAGDEVTVAAARPWPEGLGTLAAVPGRYPPQHENEAARKLAKLAGRFSGDDAITAYVRQEIARGELAIAEPPKIADVSAVRDVLLHEPVVWERDISRQHGGLSRQRRPRPPHRNPLLPPDSTKLPVRVEDSAG